MSDEEIISNFMEPDAPRDGGTVGTQLKKLSPKGWWRYSMLACNWKRPILQTCPEIEKLGRLHEVEERLTDEQWPRYRTLIQESAEPEDTRWSRILLHATAAQKIKALAVVLASDTPPLSDTGG